MISRIIYIQTLCLVEYIRYLRQNKPNSGVFEIKGAKLQI